MIVFYCVSILIGTFFIFEIVKILFQKYRDFKELKGGNKMARFTKEQEEERTSNKMPGFMRPRDIEDEESDEEQETEEYVEEEVKELPKRKIEKTNLDSDNKVEKRIANLERAVFEQIGSRLVRIEEAIVRLKSI